MASTDAKPVPKKGVAHREYFRIWKTDGTLLETAWTGIAGTRSLDGATEVATATPVQIGTTSRGYVELTASEMDYDNIGVKITVTNTDAVPVVFDLFPEEAGDIRTDVTQVSGDSTAADNLELACDNYSVTRGLAGTALPNAAADAAGGLPISDAGGLDLDAKLATPTSALATAAALTTHDGKLDTVDTEVGQIKTRVETALPDAAAGEPDGLHILGENTAGAEYLGVVVFESGISGDISGTFQGSVTGNVGGIAGAVNTFDELFAAQTTQHTATQSAVSTVDGKVDTLLTRITSTLFSGITSMAEWLGLLAGKQVGDSTARTEIRATGAGSGTFDETDHSLEAIRERGDIGWTTGAGGSAPTEAEIYTYFTSESRENAFKATGFSTHDAADVYTYFTSSNRQNTFRATGYSTHSASDVYAAMGNGSNLTGASSGVTTDLTAILFGTTYRSYRITDAKAAIGDCQLVLQGLSNIEAVNSQTEFEIQLGSTDDDAYLNCMVVLLDETNATQKSVRKVTDYDGSTKTITIESAPDFTIQVGDSVVILPALPAAGGTGGGATAEEIRIEMDDNSTKLAEILLDTDTTLPALISGIGGTVGPGGRAWPEAGPLVVQSGGLPVGGVKCWITTDADPEANVVAGFLMTNDNGEASANNIPSQFQLDDEVNYWLHRNSSDHDWPIYGPFRYTGGAWTG
jgi:hypothetical protein